MNMQISKLEQIIIYIYCLLLTLPIVSQILPTIIIMCSYIIIGIIILMRFKVIKTENMFLLLIALFLIGVPIVLRQGITVKSFYQIYYNILPLIVGFYIINFCDRMFCKKILNLFLLTTFVTTITTCYGLIKNPTIARFLATGNNEFYELSKWGNIGGFEFIYAMVILLICYVVLYKKGQIRFLTFLVLYISGIYCVFLSQYTLALLLSLLSLILFIFSTAKFSTRRCIILCIFISVILFQKEIIIFFINSIRGIVSSEIVSERLDYLLDSLNNVNNQSDVSLRFDAYEKSWNAFNNNIFSINYSKNFTQVGGHSTILDLMGVFGILGLLALILFYTISWKQFYKRQLRRVDRGYFTFMFLVLIVMQIFNPISLLNHIFCIVMPLIVKTIDSNDDKKIGEYYENIMDN